MRMGTTAGFLPVLLILFIAATSAQFTAGQTPTPPPRPAPTAVPEVVRAVVCPTVMVQPQQPMVRDGQPAAFIANIAGGDPQVQPTVVWTLSAGTIKSGQNSRRIEVDSTGSGAGREIVADVWVGGYSSGCLLQSKATIKVIPSATKFGEFGEVAPDDLKFHAKTLADFLAQSQDNLYILAYSGRKSERGFALNWIKRIREELTTAGLPPNRVLAVDAGFREEPLFDFWIVPQGSEPPRPAPTVDRREIVYPPTTRPPVKRP